MSNTNINVHSLEFWQKVRRDYISYVKLSSYYFICHASDTFSDAWANERKPIHSLATLFLKKRKTEYGQYFPLLSSGVLFSFGYKPEDVVKRDMREDFIDWCIERFSKELRET